MVIMIILIILFDNLLKWSFRLPFKHERENNQKASILSPDHVTKCVIKPTYHQRGRTISPGKEIATSKCFQSLIK